MRQQRRIDQHARALHPEQDLAHRHFERCVDVQQPRLPRDARIEHVVQLQRDVGVLGRVRGRGIDVDLVEADLLRALAGDFRIGDGLHVEMPPRQGVHVVRLVRFQHVGFEQRVVRHAFERDAVVGQHVLVVLDVLAELPARRIGEPGRKAGEHASRGRAGRARPDSGARAGCSRRGPGPWRTKGRRCAPSSGRGWSSRCRSTRDRQRRCATANARSSPRRRRFRNGGAPARALPDPAPPLPRMIACRRAPRDRRSIRRRRLPASCPRRCPSASS